MAKTLIAVKPPFQTLSTADLKQEFENQQLPYYPFSAERFLALERQYEHEWRAIQEAKEEEARHEIEIGFYRRKRQEAHYLKIAYTILGEDTGENLENFELIPNFKRQEFIDIAFKWLHLSDFKKLADNVYKIYERRNSKLVKIENFDDPEVSYGYYNPNPAALHVDQDGVSPNEPTFKPNDDYIQLECEVKELENLSDELTVIVDREEEREEQERQEQRTSVMRAWVAEEIY